jgi:type 1 glutamine amidotransferase
MKRVLLFTLLAGIYGIDAQLGGATRPADSKTIRGAAAGLLGWRFAIPSSAFRQSSFSEAAGKVDGLGVGFIQGSSPQLDYNASPDELAKIKSRLAELRMRMLSYHVDKLEPDRKLFEFAKSLNVETIVGVADPAAFANLDQLAGEFGINVALDNEPKSVMSALAGRSNRIGIDADLGKWSKPMEGLSLVKDRLLSVNLRDRTARSGDFLLQMSRMQPPETPEWPPKCTNCAGPRVPVKPLIITADTSTAGEIEAYEKALRPAMGYRVDEIGRKTPITSTAQIPADERQKIDANLPKQALVKPKKARKLLVIDLCPQGGFYHATIAHANYALQLLAKNTGAFEPVFSNDLDNLKYPRIKQYDAVFLNSVVGELFPDPDVLSGLTRFVREGGGLAGIHGSTYASMNLPEYGDLIGAWDGPHAVETATLKIDDPNSPLTKGFGGKGFTYVDEFYHFIPTGPFSRDKLHVLISIDTPKSDMTRWKNVRPDGDYGITWIKSYGKGRVFNCAMGHTPTLFANPALAQHILAAIQFVLGDLEADTTPSARLAAKR